MPHTGDTCSSRQVAVFAAALALVADAAAAQSAPPAALSDIFTLAIRFVALWACGGWILWFIAFILIGQLLGLQAGALRALGVSLLGGVFAIVPTIGVSLVLQDAVSSNALGLLVQVIFFVGMSFAAMIVLKTDFTRALLLVLLSAIVPSVVLMILVIIAF